MQVAQRRQTWVLAQSNVQIIVIVNVMGSGGVYEGKAYQRPPVPVELSLVRSGCWLTAPEMASKSAGQANHLSDAGTSH